MKAGGIPRLYLRAFIFKEEQDERQRNGDVGGILLDLRGIIDEGGGNSKEGEGKTAGKRGGDLAHKKEHQDQGETARQERKQAERIFRIAEQQRDRLLKEEEPDGRALVVR